MTDTTPARPRPAVGSAPAASPRAPGVVRRATGGGLTTAAVIGADVAGLLAAGVLSEFYDRVVLLDRDAARGRRGRADPPELLGPARPLRGVVPRLLDDLLPGTTAELVRRGVRAGDLGRVVVHGAGRHRLAPCDTGLRALSGGTATLEAVLRDRVGDLPGVEIRVPAYVLDLLFDEAGGPTAGAAAAGPGGVVGVRVTSEGGRGDENVPTDLVVDASGRSSRTAISLARHAHEVPQEESAGPDRRSTTRRFRLPREHDPGWAAVVQAPGPAPGPASPGPAVCRWLRAVPSAGAVAAHLRDDEWLVTLSGPGAAPPGDLAGFRAFALALGRPELDALLAVMEPLGDAVTPRATWTRRRRYERLAQAPDGVVVVGDALVSLDPTDGWDAAIAVAHAHSLRDRLRDRLRDGVTAPPRPLGADFFGRAAASADGPWRRATGRAPGRSWAGVAAGVLADAQLEAIAAAATRDPSLARAVLVVDEFAAPVSTLFSGAVVAAAVRDGPARLGLGRRGPASCAGSGSGPDRALRDP